MSRWKYQLLRRKPWSLYHSNCRCILLSDQIFHETAGAKWSKFKNRCNNTMSTMKHLLVGFQNLILRLQIETFYFSIGLFSSVVMISSECACGISYTWALPSRTEETYEYWWSQILNFSRQRICSWLDPDLARGQFHNSKRNLLSSLAYSFVFCRAPRGFLALSYQGSVVSLTYYKNFY